MYPWYRDFVDLGFLRDVVVGTSGYGVGITYPYDVDVYIHIPVRTGAYDLGMIPPGTPGKLSKFLIGNTI